MSKKSPRAAEYVGHMLEAISQIRSYTAGLGETEFLSVRLIQDAVVRNIEILGACRTFRAGRVESQSGRMQGAARRQWLFHCQASQRRRRRFGAQPSGPGALLVQGCVATRLFGMTKPRIVAPCPAPKSPPARPRGKSDRLLGEAAQNIRKHCPELAEAHSEVPWQDIYGMRNRLAHGYFEVNYRAVWQVVVRELPVLEPMLHAISDKLAKARN